MSPGDRELTERLWWLCRLRWLAAAGIVMFSLGLPVPVGGLLGTGVSVAAYNLLLLGWMRAAREPEGLLAPTRGSLFAHGQIALDLLALTGVIHLTGGLASPLGPYL